MSDAESALIDAEYAMKQVQFGLAHKGEAPKNAVDYVAWYAMSDCLQRASDGLERLIDKLKSM